MTDKRITQTLSCAVSTLLGISAPIVKAAEPWNLDLGLLTYIEKDRNTGIELLVSAQRILDDDDEFTLGIEVDTLTGATPNGATPSNVPQTFTTSSGNDTYTSSANELPADDTHGDTRLAVDVDYKDQFTDTFAINYNGRLSMEFDYLSIGLGNGYQLDLNQNNTSLYFGFNGEHNAVHPIGNIPDALATMTPQGEPQNRNTASKNRSALEAAIGLTQVIDRRSLLQFRYTHSSFKGYLNDPYKLLSVVDDQNTASLGNTLEYRFEKRPKQREIDTAYIAYKRDIGSGIVNLSMRYSQDDWDLQSTTLDLRYRHRLNNNAYLEPHIRFYNQQQAKFYRHSLTSSESLPQYASSDTRLASLDALTVGLKFITSEVKNKRYSLMVEYYTQQGESHPADAVGLQTDQDLFPTLQTLLVKATYSTEW